MANVKIVALRKLCNGKIINSL